ncbi:hypothetical protein [Nocardia xishanensis]
MSGADRTPTASQDGDLIAASRLVAELQDETERWEQYSHLSPAYSTAYRRKLHQLTAARTQLERLKRGQS